MPGPPPPEADAGAPPPQVGSGAAPAGAAAPPPPPERPKAGDDHADEGAGDGAGGEAAKPRRRASKAEAEVEAAEAQARLDADARRAKAARGYTKIVAGYDQEAVRMFLRGRMHPLEVEEIQEEHKLDPDIEEAISFSVESFLRDRPELAGSAPMLGLAGGFFLLRFIDTAKTYAESLDMDEGELAAIRRERREYLIQRRRERESKIRGEAVIDGKVRPIRREE
jgi:hypothetical protein